ncbi:MAG: hypothetical protein J7L58_02620 [Thermoplasmata archaeon]|nr:hypothetical protein [Thermoplasmata archaeon]
MIAVVAAMMNVGTRSYFSDIETGNDNTFTAGTLDLNVDGQNTNVVKFTVANLRPGNQPRGMWNISNVGSINGYLDIENIVVTSYEYGLLDPEQEAGDTTGDDPGEGNGELQDVLNLRLFIDRDCDGWISTGDYVFFNDKVANLPDSFDLNESIPAGGYIHIVAIFDWWPTSNDNIAQSDGFELDMTFELAQTAAQ